MHGLYAWLRHHPHCVDGVLALGVIGLGTIPTMWLRYPWITPIIAVLAGTVVIRRSYPVAAFAVGIAAGAVQVLTIAAPNAADFALMILLYTLAACRPRRISLYGLTACLVGGVVACAQWGMFDRTRPSTALVGMSTLLACPLLAWLLGDGVRWRRGYYLALEERATRLERERDALAQVAAAAERARIAREMHDVVAHNVSVMVIQADGGLYALDGAQAQGTAPDKTRDALTAISQTGRQALAEMRRLLGVLRGADAVASLGPMPGLGDLGPLIEQTRAAGIQVTFSSSGSPPAGLDGGANLAAYRVVQEALTNVRKHGGPRVAARVSVSYAEDGLTIRVTDDGRGAAALTSSQRRNEAGHGLAGMRERVSMYGGTVAAGPRAGGGFEVTATLPARSAA